MREVLQLLLSNLDEAYEKKAWHGPNLRGALRGLGVADALRRPAPGRHNIWELTIHAAYWKYTVRRRLTGARRGSFPLKGSNFFAAPASATQEEWTAMIRLLDTEHRALRTTIAALRDADLEDPKKRRLITGIAAHDLYHTGQIQLVKRLVTK